MARQCLPRRVGSWFCLLVILYVIPHLVELSDAQAYHFSKGWMPGRKRSGAGQLVGDAKLGSSSSAYGELDRLSAPDLCAVKSQSYQLALDILKARYLLFNPLMPTVVIWVQL